MIPYEQKKFFLSSRKIISYIIPCLIFMLLSCILFGTILVLASSSSHHHVLLDVDEKSGQLFVNASIGDGDVAV